MLTGASILQLDSKGRLAIPSRYREALMERCGGALKITRSLFRQDSQDSQENNDNNDSKARKERKAREERCLWMYPLDAWDPVAKKVAELPDHDAKHRAFKRTFIGQASDIEMDKNGRVLLPALLRDFAAITKGVYLIGQSNKFELWSEEKWAAGHEQWLMESIDMDNISPELKQLAL